MSDDNDGDDEWDFYPCRVDDRPASIFLNLRYERAPQPSSINTLYWVRIHMSDAAEHGMGSPSEAEALYPVEDALTDAAAKLGLEYVGRLRNSGDWQVTFYGPTGHADALNALAREAELGGRAFETGSKPDHEWKYYREFARMSESEHVVCGKHGSTPITFACRHLASGIACGFHSHDGDPAERWPDAWCDGCEEQRRAAGGWTDELTLAVMKILCTHCWESARARNERVPPLARGKAARLSEDEQGRLIAAATDQLKRVQEAADAKWRFQTFPRWDFDSDKRTVTFSDKAGRRLIAAVRMVGSYATKSSSFQWSWVLYDHDEPMIDGVAELPTFGEVRGIERLTTNYWDCDIVEGWEMTALAAYVLGCDAVYRAPFDDLYWFMLLSGFREMI